MLHYPSITSGGIGMLEEIRTVKKYHITHPCAATLLPLLSYAYILRSIVRNLMQGLKEK